MTNCSVSKGKFGQSVNICQSDDIVRLTPGFQISCHNLTGCCLKAIIIDENEQFLKMYVKEARFLMNAHDEQWNHTTRAKLNFKHLSKRKIVYIINLCLLWVYMVLSKERGVLIKNQGSITGWCDSISNPKLNACIWQDIPTPQ